MTLHELKKWIREACAKIGQQILHNVQQEDEYWFDVDQAINGTHTNLYSYLITVHRTFLIDLSVRMCLKYNLTHWCQN